MVTMQRVLGLAIAVGTLATTAVDADPLTPAGVSPGAEAIVLTASGSCPTFSWAADPVDGFELTVLTDTDNKEALYVNLPGGALSWTPAFEQCLEPGGVYGWSIRALIDGVPTEWSQPLLFRVSLEPTAEEVARAVEILSAADARPGAPVGARSASTVERSQSQFQPFAPSTPVANEVMELEGDAGMSVDGVVEVYGLLSQSADAGESNNIVADGKFSTPLGAIEAPLIYVNPGGQLGGTTWLRSPAVGELEIGRGTGSDPDARVFVDLMSVHSISTTVLKSSSRLGWIGNGGSGVTTVPLNGSDQLRLDSAGDECPAGSVATGLRLKKVDSNQAGVELECSD